MKLTTFRSGEKGSEEEKVKIFEKEEVKVMSLTKEEQLRKVFNHLFTALFAEYDVIQAIGCVSEEKELKEKYVNIFLKEFTIRTKL